ncbi:MAG: GNAT family N-acetyltransferase [Fusobacteriaceae bacterium]
MRIEIKKFNELTGEEIYEIFKIRAEIFVVEQNCIYNDLDKKDKEAIHLMMKDKNEVKAYLRILKPGVSYPASSLGRVLVVKEARRKGFAEKILKEGIKYILQNYQGDKITIGAQEYLKEFYKKLGFEIESEVYLEDGIKHIDMSYKK